MADEAATTIVLKMRDEASQKMNNFGDTTQAVTLESLQLQVALTAVGGALSALGGILGMIDNPAAKAAQTFLMFGGALFSTAAAIGTVIPVIKSLVGSLKSLAIIQTIVKAMQGPVGWAQIGIGLGIAGVATAGIIAMSNRGNQTQNMNITMTGGPLIVTDEAGVRRFARDVTDAQRSDQAVGR